MANSPQPGSLFNALTAGSTIIGNITAVSDIRIDGTLEGNLNCTGKVIIGEKGVVKGNITAQTVETMGKVIGKVIVKGVLTLKSTSTLEGEIDIQTLVIEPKAIFNGTCTMKGGATTVSPQEKR